MGSTAAPEVVLFKRFQAQWKFIDKTLFATIVTNKDFADIIIDESLIAWAENSLKESKDLRGDHGEFIELSLIYGSYPSMKNSFFGSWSNAPCKVDIQTNILIKNLDFS